jgi:aspartyl protease family protein
MNHSIPSLILALSLTLTSFTLKTSAQSDECVFQGANGRNVDISRLCGGNRGTTTRVNSSSSNNKSGVFLLPIKRRVNGIPTVDVTFNGRHNFEMLFDTGATGIVLTDDMAQAIGIKKERQISASTAGGMVVVHLGRASSVQAGNLTKKDLVVGISSHMDTLGLLGQNFFGNYDVTIKKEVIELRTRSGR